jgi:CBS domain-containing protein
MALCYSFRVKWIMPDIACSPRETATSPVTSFLNQPGTLPSVSGVDSGLRVLDAMTIKPVVAHPEMTIRDVAALMDKHQIGSVLIKEGSELLGIVTEADYVRRAVLEGHDTVNTPVSKIMTRDLVTVSPGVDVLDALLLMKDADVKHLPVVDDGRLVGFVTLKDILKIQPNLFENIVDMLEIREEHRKPMGKIQGMELDQDLE